MQRDLTCWRGRSGSDPPNFDNFPADELANIAAAYQTDPPIQLAKKHRFTGVFDRRMPVDEITNRFGGEQHDGDARSFAWNRITARRR